MSQLGAAIGGGMLPHEAMEQAAIGIGESVARISVDQRGAVDFDSDAPAPKQPMMLPTALSRVISEGLEKAHGIDRVRRRLDGHSRATLTVVPPDGSASSEWGLPALALRLMPPQSGCAGQLRRRRVRVRKILTGRRAKDGKSVFPPIPSLRTSHSLFRGRCPPWERTIGSAVSLEVLVSERRQRRARSSYRSTGSFLIS